MTKIDIKDFGIDEAKVFNAVVDRIADQLITEPLMNEFGDEVSEESFFAKKVQKSVQSRIDEAVTALADQYIAPDLTKFLEEFCVQETNSWGEKKGKKFTFVEYLVERANRWFIEPVNYNGKTKSESRDSYNWRSDTTRTAYMINDHLKYELKRALETAFKDLNKSVAAGLDGAVKMELAKVLKNINIKTEVK